MTGKARAAIRRATRTAIRTQYAGLGRRIVERLFQRAKMEYADDKLKGALPRLARTSIDDVMAAVGRGEMKASDVARAMYPDYREERVGAATSPRKVRGTPLASTGVRPWHADPDPRHQFRSAGTLCAEWRRCPGRSYCRHRDPWRGHHHLSDRVAGSERIRGHAPALARRRWNARPETQQRFPARLFIQQVNEPGSLAQLATVIAEHDGKYPITSI